MKIFAHRGWSEGKEENTIFAFKKAVEAKLDGVEFDVRYGTDGATVVLSHDKTTDSTTLTFDTALQFLEPSGLELLIEFKEYTDEFYKKVIASLRQHNLTSRTTIFSFPEIAGKFPWDNRQDIKLGIIAPYPQDIKKYIEMYNPDMVLMGWGTSKERLMFKTAWTFLSLKKTFAKYPAIKFVIGVAYFKKDLLWLSKQAGLYGITADMPIK